MTTTNTKTRTNTAKPTVHSFLTLDEWDNASNEQRKWWLDNGYLVSPEDGKALAARRINP